MKRLFTSLLSIIFVFSLVISARPVTNVKAATTTDELNGDWTLPNVALENTKEAELMVRVGDIDNMGYPWGGINPFTGKETAVHGYPYKPASSDPGGTDRIMIATGYAGSGSTDGYTSSTYNKKGYNTKVSPINFTYNLKGKTVSNATIQIFIDDIQPSKWVKSGTKWINNGRGGFSTSSYNKYEVYFTLEGKQSVRVPEFEEVINSLDQHGPIGKLVTFTVPDKYLSLFQDGESGISLKIDDTRTKVTDINGKTISNTGDGYAIDFAKLLINKNDGHTVYNGTIQGKAYEGSYDNNNALQKSSTTLSGVKLTISGVKDPIYTDSNGSYISDKVPAGQVIITAEKDGYEKATFTVDKLESGQTLNQDIVLIKTDKPLSPSISLNTYSPTNKDLTVTIDYKGDVTKKYYNIDGGAWLEYNGSFNVDKNCIIEAKSSKDIKVSANSIKTVESDVTTLAVTNIDKTKPQTPTLTPSTTAPTNQNITVTATYPSNATTKEVSIDNGVTWKNYTDAITITDNTVVKARCKNEAGSYSDIATLIISNIDRTPPTASVEYETNADRTITATLVNPSEKITVTNNNGSWNYVFRKNGEFTFEFQDDAGNIGTAYAKATVGTDIPIDPTGRKER